MPPINLDTISNIPLLKYLKDPVNKLSQLYSRYLDGGEFGWFAYCNELKGFVAWDVASESWIPVSYTIGSVYDLWKAENPDGTLVDFLLVIKGDKGDPFEYPDFTEEQLLALKGADGYTPQKGIDYEDGADGYTPQKGIDYEDGADGYTPVKDVDYFDGNDGLDGRGEISRELISTVGLVKTYRITYTDSTTFEYIVSDGEKGDKGDAFEYSDFTPEQLLAIKGDTGKSAYQSYLDTTTDNPPVSEAVWAAINTIVLQLKIQSDITTLTTGDGKYIYTVPAKLNNYNLTAIHAALTTVSSSGLPSFQVHNLTDSVDILSTNVTIDATEFNSYTALSQPVINVANRNVVTGDRLRFDVDGAGTGAKGWSMILTFTKA